MTEKFNILITIKFCLTFLLLSSITSQVANAKELIIGFTYDIPPYIADNATSGLEIDIVRDALKYKGHTFKPQQFSYGELDYVVQQKGLDGAAAVQKTDDGTFYSENFIAFRNYAFTKKSAGITINSVADLKGKTIVAWQDAYKDLGPEFEALFSPSVELPYRNKYREIPDQAKQVAMFWNSEAEVIVIDESIMLWFTKHLANKSGSIQDLVYHNIFGDKTQFRVSFKDQQVRDDFNEGLKYIHEKGIYQQVIDKYLKD